MEVRIFRPNIYKTTQLVLCDILRLIFVLILIFFLILEILEKWQGIIFNPMETISIKMLLTILISLSFFEGMYTKLKYCTFSDDYFNDSSKRIYIVPSNINLGYLYDF